ncbi:MAG TPA: DUF1573 domain-containing protein [Flavilitoribacter sp.]|nr:DUF1573 domain-containing protein [Flavilitoribacter sp.]HMQ88096.1 DUF1573 domain-containing protein [Flavilitoribacter sp.]
MKTSMNFLVLTLLAAASLFPVSLSAQDRIPVAQPVDKENPVTTLKFEETVYDFGKVVEGRKVTQVFTFTNTGQEPLVLTNALGSCGCTVPKWPREPIRPGETASITVEFNSKNKIGQRNQKVTITANTEPPQTYLYLTGEVLPSEENDISNPDEKGFEKVERNPDCFVISPNPTAETLKLEMEKEAIGQRAVIAIYNQFGQVMARREIPVVEGAIEFNVSHYPAGTYTANVRIGDRKPESRCFVVVK